MKIRDHVLDLASLQELVDSLPALIHTGRPDGYLDFFNRHWLDFVGLRLEDLEGWKWTAAIHPDDVTALVSSMDRATKSSVTDGSYVCSLRKASRRLSFALMADCEFAFRARTPVDALQQT